MKTLILYDSFFGNTEKVAREIESLLSKKHEVSNFNVKDFQINKVQDFDLLIIGSPTRAFSPSENTTKFLKQLESLKGKDFAVFDTRADVRDIPKFVVFLIKLFGYADSKIVKALKSKSANEVLPSKGFFVVDKEGPLKEGEFEKIKIWLKPLL